jgi:hypothetical protein
MKIARPGDHSEANTRHTRRAPEAINPAPVPEQAGTSPTDGYEHSRWWVVETEAAE